MELHHITVNDFTSLSGSDRIDLEHGWGGAHLELMDC
jgi:hypothetical protein